MAPLYNATVKDAQRLCSGLSESGFRQWEYPVPLNSGVWTLHYKSYTPGQLPQMQLKDLGKAAMIVGVSKSDELVTIDDLIGDVSMPAKFTEVVSGYASLSSQLERATAQENRTYVPEAIALLGGATVGTIVGLNVGAPVQGFFIGGAIGELGTVVVRWIASDARRRSAQYHEDRLKGEMLEYRLNNNLAVGPAAWDLAKFRTTSNGGKNVTP